MPYTAQYGIRRAFRCQASRCFDDYLASPLFDSIYALSACAGSLLLLCTPMHYYRRHLAAKDDMLFLLQSRAIKADDATLSLTTEAPHKLIDAQRCRIAYQILHFGFDILLLPFIGFAIPRLRCDIYFRFSGAFTGNYDDDLHYSPRQALFTNKNRPPAKSARR